MNQNVLKQFTQTSNVCKNVKKFHIASKNVKVKSKNYMHNINEFKKINAQSNQPGVIYLNILSSKHRKVLLNSKFLNQKAKLN